jgi:hypothetical protein
MNFSGLLVVPTQGRGELSGGFQIGAGFGWGKIPLQLGVDFGFSAAGKQSFTYPLADMRDLLVEETRQDKFYFINVWLRLQPIFLPIVQPYVEGFAGGKALQTEYTLGFVGGDGASVQTGNGDWTRSLGWGLGIDFALSRDRPRMFIALGLRRLYSDDASFTQNARTATGDVRATVYVPMDSWLVNLGLAGSF